MAENPRPEEMETLPVGCKLRTGWIQQNGRCVSPTSSGSCSAKTWKEPSPSSPEDRKTTLWRASRRFSDSQNLDNATTAAGNRI